MHSSPVTVMLRDATWGQIRDCCPLESRLHIDFHTTNHSYHLGSASDLDCWFMAILSWRRKNHLDPVLGCNSRERTQGYEKGQGEDSSYPKGIEMLLRETARKGCPDPEYVDNPMFAPQDYDARQSGRVLELQHRDLWIRPTDLSWHFPVLVTIREMPFKNYRGRSPAKLKVREDKIEEAKKQKTRKIEARKWNSATWKHSSWTWTTSSSSSAWQEWSSEVSRERTNWQSADWDSSDQVRKVTTWQSHFSWHRGHLHRFSQRHSGRRK